MFFRRSFGQRRSISKGRDLGRNFGLKHFVKTYPYSHGRISEDGRNYLIDLYMQRGSGIKDLQAFVNKMGLVRCAPYHPFLCGRNSLGDMDGEYRRIGEEFTRADDIFQLWPARYSNTIQLNIHGIMEDILMFIGQAEEGELISQPELCLGSIAYYLQRGKAIYEMGGDLDEAISEYQRGLRAEFDGINQDSELRMSFDDMVADLHYNLGLVYRRKEQKSQAVNEFKVYLKHDSNSEWATQAREFIKELSG